MDMDEKMSENVNMTRTVGCSLCTASFLILLAYAAYVITNHSNIHVDEVQV